MRTNKIKVHMFGLPGALIGFHLRGGLRPLLQNPGCAPQIHRKDAPADPASNPFLPPDQGHGQLESSLQEGDTRFNTCSPALGTTEPALALLFFSLLPTSTWYGSAFDAKRLQPLLSLGTGEGGVGSHQFRYSSHCLAMLLNALFEHRHAIGRGCQCRFDNG